MFDTLTENIRSHRDQVYSLFRRYMGLGKTFLLRSDICDTLDAFCEEIDDGADFACGTFGAMLRTAQEAVIEAPWMYVALRPRIGRWEYVRMHAEAVDIEPLTAAEFLHYKERMVEGPKQDGEWHLEIDLEPFNRGFPRLRESRSVGHGVQFLNRRLSSQLFQDLERGDRKLFDFLRVHQYKGLQLMLNDRISDLVQLRRTLRQAEDFLSGQPQDAEWEQVGDRLRDMGFEIGWGRNVARMRDTLRLLSDNLEAPDPSNLEEFLSRIPMIFNIVIMTPHGYFGQSNVLGKPDTGGQVVYILDQARALEKEMVQRLHEQGIDIDPQILIVTRLIPDAQGTTCDQRIERVIGTRFARILRVPFRDEAGEVVPHWISRFEIWPYLERFTLEAEKEVLAELGHKPGMIIGNYSDGCLVASLMSRRLHVTQCNIAHALEKTKYLFSDLYWRENDHRYHFGCQFTADLIAMNMADFIITSTYQEIAGTGDSVGQYESYGSFTMPGLYRVVNGIDIFDPKFNVVSPGADPDVYFPFNEKDRRLTGLEEELRNLVFGPEAKSPNRGHFIDESKPIIFTMARFDRIKNLTGLIDWYGRSQRLQDLANLLVVGGHIDPNLSTDHEEREQIERAHALYDQHGLEGHMRWVGFQSERNLVGELYRTIADHRGVFVQPALFEAYGLTVIEAMTSGLPTFATCYGGPSEIIVDGQSGFHIDPNHGDDAAAKLIDFFETCEKDPQHWERFSDAVVQRVRTRYTWDLYAKRMMTLSRIYGFWKYVTNLERQETRRYLEMLYSLQFRPLADGVPHG